MTKFEQIMNRYEDEFCDKFFHGNDEKSWEEIEELFEQAKNIERTCDFYTVVGCSTKFQLPKKPVYKYTTLHTGTLKECEEWLNIFQDDYDEVWLSPQWFNSVKNSTTRSTHFYE